MVTLSPEHRRELAPLTPSMLAMHHMPNFHRARHVAYAERVIMRECFQPGGCRRVLVTEPPRHGKSTYGSGYLPGWAMGTFPDQSILFGSYETTYAESWGEKARDIVAECGLEVFGVKVDPARDSRGHWRTLYQDESGAWRKGGTMQSAGLKGGFTGKGANGFIVDDPIKSSDDADSQVIRDRLWDRFLSTIETRLEPDAWIVVILTRWHEDDIGGRILNLLGHEWYHLDLPAIAGDVAPCECPTCLARGGEDAIGRKTGEALWPERWTLDAMEAKRDRLVLAEGQRWWDAMYQGRPRSATGNVFNHRWWKARTFWIEKGWICFSDGQRVHGKSLTTYLVTDLATSERQTADFCVHMAFGVTPMLEGDYGRLPSGRKVTKTRRLLLLDVDRDRFAGPDIIPAGAETGRLWLCPTWWLEDRGFQLSEIQRAKRAGFNVRRIGGKLTGDDKSDLYVGRQDKMANAYAATPVMEAGFFWVHAQDEHGTPQEWFKTWESEMLGFGGGGAFDDQVDVTSWGCRIWQQMFLSSVVPPDLPDDEDGIGRRPSAVVRPPAPPVMGPPPPRMGVPAPRRRM